MKTATYILTPVEESPIITLVGASIAALAGTSLWIEGSVYFHLPFAFMAVLVGVVVGITARVFGSTPSWKTGLLSAGVVILAYGYGNVLFAFTYVVQHFETQYFDVLRMFEWNFLWHLILDKFALTDLFFYSLGILAAYRISSEESFVTL